MQTVNQFEATYRIPREFSASAKPSSTLRTRRLSKATPTRSPSGPSLS